ncbi:DUF418 domain-containing protein [Nonomuraea sp. NPDC050663]|uniref:DUF418 domain-containing protein n=1 Tax=Nonomuraea sp. NPDC050663 TaxID=3364370 RepID=UPI00378BB7AB
MLPLQHAPSPATRARLLWLDVVRGFALCGILLANVRPIANAGEAVIAAGPAPAFFGQMWPGLFVDQRFYPIFSLLFGVGFALLYGSAQARSPRPRLILLRRLLVLLALGLAHMFLLWRGDVLTIYAVAGLVALLPSTWLPRWAVAVLGAVVVAASLALSGGAFTLVPGLFLLGAALVRYGVVDAAERSAKGAVAGVALFAVPAVPLLVWQVSLDPADPAFSRAFALAGLAVAGVYVCAMAALMHTCARRALVAAFAPLGRMALTNYLSATAIVLAVRPLVGGTPDQWGQGTVAVIAGAVLAAQWAWSSWWLARYRQGPLEWLWRWATWGHRPPFKRTPPTTT